MDRKPTFDPSVVEAFDLHADPPKGTDDASVANLQEYSAHNIAPRSSNYQDDGSVDDASFEFDTSLEDMAWWSVNHNDSNSSASQRIPTDNTVAKHMPNIVTVLHTADDTVMLDDAYSDLNGTPIHEFDSRENNVFHQLGPMESQRVHKRDVTAARLPSNNGTVIDESSFAINSSASVLPLETENKKIRLEREDCLYIIELLKDSKGLLPLDIKIGRGGSNTYTGNRYYRAYLRRFHDEYQRSRDDEKKSFRRDIILPAIKGYGGRFMKFVKDGPKGYYKEVDDETALKKIANRMRDMNQEMN